MTEAERSLWFALRNRRLGGHKFRSQSSIWPFVADFCCIEARLIVEVDGGQHSEANDARRTAALQEKGFRVIRFWNHDVLGNLDGVLQVILETLGGERLKEEKEEDPHLNPLPQAGEGA
jgi:adenine-specific DNA-methyltransferase